ncbi:hypothetical protein JOL79_04240 [Microbispora sp. RL4-1S]|uniref:Uncharacterized protein n=1 Tax=Microbispora oryzae TaxID=2806554 RepID=A0A940WKX9_9ACTN|nr:hypothetical protein [Microbispora oryzae]MBP2703011.1 hypothetical protein [Microbispora oryzae]
MGLRLTGDVHPVQPARHQRTHHIHRLNQRLRLVETHRRTVRHTRTRHPRDQTQHHIRDITGTITSRRITGRDVTGRDVTGRTARDVPIRIGPASGSAWLL